MSFPEFGKVIENASPLSEEGTFPEFGKVVEPVSRARSLAGAFPKGAVKKAADITELLQKIPLPKGPAKPEAMRQFAAEKFPTLEREPEKLLERAGGVTTEALLQPGGIVAKSIQIPLATGLGYLTEKLGAPGWAQAIAESLPFFFSGGKKIPLKADQKKLGQFLRKQGLTENEITPLLKTPEQINRWSKFASKGKKSRELMESIYNKTGQIYSGIEKAAGQLPNPHLSPQAAEKFLMQTSDIIESMPHKYRSLIKQDALDLIKSEGTFNGITNFYQDINAVIGAEHGGRAIVGQLKKPVMEALESISPQLANDFGLATDFYRTRAKVAGSIINPKDFDKFLDIGEAYALGQGIFNRDLGMIMKTIGVAGGRSLAREMLINPRLQNISIRIGEALKKNKLTLVTKYMTQFNDELRKDDPETASLIDEAMTK